MGRCRFSTILLAVMLMSPFETSLAQNLPKFSDLMFGDYYYVLQNHDRTQNVEVSELRTFRFEAGCHGKSDILF